MFGKFTYLGLTLIFTGPLIAYLWRRFPSALRRGRRAILSLTGLAVLYGFFVWPLGLLWGCWAYSEDKILGLRAFGAVFEDLVWWACIAFLYAGYVHVAAAAEDRRESLLAALAGASKIS